MYRRLQTVPKNEGTRRFHRNVAAQQARVQDKEIRWNRKIASQSTKVRSYSASTTGDVVPTQQRRQENLLLVFLEENVCRRIYKSG